jgi:two-component sensor histidine kinase
VDAGDSELDELRRALAAQQQVEAELRETIAAQDRQFRKLTHRLKNNLQLVISIISLRLGAVADDARRRELEDVLSKIHAVALVQRKLHDAGMPLTLSFDEYLAELTANLPRPPSGPAPPVVLDTAPVIIGIDRAVPLGLIANELITFAALPPGDAPLHVALSQRDTTLTLTIARAGMTLPDLPGRPDYGLQLVRALVRQIHAELTLEPGQSVRLTFAAEPPVGS